MQRRSIDLPFESIVNRNIPELGSDTNETPIDFSHGGLNAAAQVDSYLDNYLSLLK